MVNALAADMRRRLLVALGHDRPSVTPTEQRVWTLRERWQMSRSRSDYAAFREIAAACPHAQTTAYRKEASNGALSIYLRCRSCGVNPVGAGVSIPHDIVRTCGVDPYLLPLEDGVDTPIYDPCAHCGERKPGEWHHFAPRRRFVDPESWPVSYLCNECHRLWHDVMGWGNEPWAKKQEGA